MWAAQFYRFEEPNRWMTSGGLGTMGYGLPTAVKPQMAHPDALVVDIAGEASVQMTMQEFSTAVQFDLPIKIFILNNEWMGMVRQWQQLLHGERYSHSYSESLPDFVKLAEAMGGVGIRAETPDELDAKIMQMIDTRTKQMLFDCRVAKEENCFPMIPSAAPTTTCCWAIPARPSTPPSTTKARCWCKARSCREAIARATTGTTK